MLRGVHCVLVSHFHWDREWYRTFTSVSWLRRQVPSRALRSVLLR